MSTKPLLKRLAARYVPPEVVYRRKQGFSVPVAEWMRGSLGRVTAEMLLSEVSLRRGIVREEAVRTLLDEHRSGRANHGQRLWALLHLELWMRLFLDRTLSPTEPLPVVRGHPGLLAA